ncbi:unnamed protein product [Ectocarpus sp. 12 AP-2014]
MAAKTRAGSAEGDRTALGNTRFAFSLPQWREARGLPISSWTGVHVNDGGRVEKLDLHGKQLKCVFPRQLCELDAIKELILHTNRISGTLPAKLGELSELEKLDLWDNFLEGTIPKTLAKLSALTELHLSGNFLTGPIPRELGKLSNLRVLYLHGNKLSGQIPRSLGDLKRLQKLVLIDNRLTGPIPPELGNLKVVVEINLANNRLSGPIPAELGQLSNLTKLYLWGNNLSGSIPEELGELALLEKLDVAQNALLMSGGGIPLSLRNHCNFRRFVFAIPEHGAPIPPWRSKRSLLPALLLGYLDLFTDLATVLSFWSSGLTPWFAIGFAFIAGPALCAGAYVLREETVGRGIAAATQLGLIVEGLISVKEESYSHALVAMRVLEPLFQSLPMLLLQTHVLLVSEEFLALRVVSVVVSTLSLAVASTGIVAEHPLSQLRWSRGVKYPTAKLPLASSMFFGTVPFAGSVRVRMGFQLHPQDFVWWFLLYQVMEIISRVLSLGVIAMPLGYYFFCLLGWLWLTRTSIACVSIGDSVVRERLRFRKLIRFAAAPIMDSVIDRVKAYKVSCFFTCVETACFLAVGNALPHADETRASDLARRVFSVISLLAMGGKIALGTVLVVPFKAKISENSPPAKGELRPLPGAPGESSSDDDSIRKSRRNPGGLGDGTTGPALPIPGTADISMDSIMAAVDTAAVAAVPAGDGSGPVDVETGGGSRGGASTGDSGTITGTLAVQTVEEGRRSAYKSGGGDGDGDGTSAGRDTTASPGCKEGEDEERNECVRSSWAGSATEEGDEKQDGVAPSHEV